LSTVFTALCPGAAPDADAALGDDGVGSEEPEEELEEEQLKVAATITSRKKIAKSLVDE
jgi:hypothetical protein